MKRVIRRLATMVAVGFAVGLFGVSGARASDIDCKSPASGSPVRCEDPRGVGMRCTLATDDPRPSARKHHLICGSSRLSERYERIYAEQQRMLRKGTIHDSDITAWRARRDACDSVRCLEGMFARFWRERDAMRNAPARPAAPPQAATAMSSPATQEPAPTTTQGAQEQPASTESLAMQARPEPTELTRPTEAPTSSPATHEPAPTTAPTQSVQEQPTSTESPAMQVGAEPTEFALLTATPVETPAAMQAAARPIAKAMNSSPGKSRPAALALESLFSGVAVLGIGAGLLWTRRNARAGDRSRSTVRAVMVIAYVLLFVNALLLPFTLGLG